MNIPSPTGHLLLQATLRFEQSLLSALDEAGIDDIGLSQLGHLQHLGQEGLSQARLAALSGLSKQGVNKSVAELVQKGYVELRPDPRDGRARRVCLTRNGAQLMARVAGLVKDIELDYLNRLGHQYHDLRRALGQLLD